MKAVFSYLGALLMLLSGISVNLDFHLCQGKVKSLGIFAEANVCRMAKSQNTCLETGANGWNKTNCCKDVNLAYHSNAFDFSSEVLNPDVLESPQIISYRIDHMMHDLHVPVRNYIDYPPPDPLSVEVYKVLETYLI